MTEEATMSVSYNINTSLSEGDQLYCSCQLSSDGFSISNANSPIFFGVVTSVNPGVIGFHYTTVSGITPLDLSCAGTQFISFAKNSAINKSSLKGYYNLVTFINDDNNREAELFMVNSETTLSSK